MKYMRIAIDLDNVILDVPTTIINLHNKLNENKLDYKQGDKLGWKFDPLIKTDEELSELFKLFDNPQFYDNPIVFKDAIEVINQLSRHNYVVIISKHMKSRKPLTRKWVYETFPRVDLVFTENFQDKGEILKNFDIILDDRVDVLESCTDVTCKICYGKYSWNESWNGFRVNSWLGFKAFVDKIQKLDIR
jgi:5'(3')-deoxyribonucleotidase